MTTRHICNDCDEDVLDDNSCGCPPGDAPQTPTRPEAGPIVFDGDWRAYLIRGDDAFNLHCVLGRLLDAVDAGRAPDKVAAIVARNFCNALADVDHHKPVDGLQRCRPWAECVEPGDGHA
jgi:hypothetical protein